MFVCRRPKGEIVPENPTETQFQIMSVNRLPPEHEVYIASTPMRQKNIMYGDNLSGNYIVTCPDLGVGLRMASVAVNGARMSPGDPASASAIVKSINDGSTGMTHKDRRISQAMFAANAETESLTTTYGSVAVCGGVGCTKKGVSLCSGCKVVNYCSKECQVGHWRAHKEDCKKAAAHLARMKQDGDVAPAGRVPFNMTAIQSQVVAILAKADQVAKAYGLRSYHAFDSVHTTAKETGDYAPLTKLLEEKVGKDRTVAFCADLIQLFDFDASVAQLDLRVWGNSHYNRLESTYHAILRGGQETQKLVLYVQKGISDMGRQMRARLQAQGVDLASLTTNPRPLLALL